MTSHPSDPQESSFEFSVSKILSEFAENAASKSAKEFISKLATNSDLSDEESTKLKSLQTLFSVRFQTKFRKSTSKAEQLSPPSGIAFGPDGSLVVADDFNHRIQIYDKDFQLIRTFGGKGNKEGELTYPRGIAIDSEGSIYVADSWNHRIQKFDKEGCCLKTIGSYGNGKGEFNEPYDILIQPEGSLVVVERYNHRLQFIDADGISLGWIGARGIEREDRLAQIHDTEPKLFSRPVFEFPTSLACDSLGNYYLADSGNHRIVKFDGQWNIVGYLGMQGEEPGQFQYSLSIAVDSEDFIYVTDLNNDRVQVFTSSGKWLFAFGDAQGNVSLNSPCLVKIGPDGRIFVCVTFDPSVFVYSVDPLESLEINKTLEELHGNDVETVFQRAQELEAKGEDQEAFKLYTQALTSLASVQSEIELEEKIGFRDVFEIPIVFAQLGNELGAEKKSGPLILQSLKFYDLKIEQASQNLLDHLASWHRVGELALDKILREESRTLAGQEDSLTFDKEFYLATKDERDYFRKTEELFFKYRRLVKRKWKFFNIILSGNLSSESMMECFKSQSTRWFSLCNHISDLLSDKEKREESMVADFSGMNDSEEKWRNFRSKLQANQRVFAVVQNFVFEIRALFSAFKNLWLKTNESLLVQAIADLFKKKENISEMHKILAGIQEDSSLLSFVRNDYLDIMDGIILFDESNKNFMPRSLSLEDFSPIPHDYEKTPPEEILRTIVFELAAIERLDEGLLCGNEIISIESIETQAENISDQLQKNLKNMEVFEKNADQFMDNMESLVFNKTKMKTNLREVDPRDKKAPIPIHNNLLTIEFQTALVGRMIKTLEINETHNLIRLISGVALLKSQSRVNELEKVNAVLKSIAGFEASLSEKNSLIQVQIKDKSLERGRIERELSQPIFQDETDEIDRAGKLKEEKIHIDLLVDRLNFKFHRYSKALKLLKKIDAITKPKVEPKGFSMEVQYAFGRTGFNSGQFLHPGVMAQNSKGDVFMIDRDKNQIFIYTPQGILQRTIGRCGNAPGSFNSALGIKFDEFDNFYVADTFNKRIQKFDEEGNFLLSFGDRGSEENRLCEIYSISISERGEVWVADYEHKRIVIFDSQGNWVKAIEPKLDQDNWDEPIAVCCIEGGGYFVTDKSSAVLRKCNANGDTEAVLDKVGMDIGLLFDLHFDKRFGLFAPDFFNRRIYLLDDSLRFKYIYDCSGKRLGEFGNVIAVSTFADQLFAVDSLNHRIQVFSLTLN
jgi:DNA-binding beta-propeller fold protein YncE